MNKTPEFFDKYAVVSYSGGMDSTCLVLHLLSQGYNVSAYSFDYGQNHSVELHHAADNAKYMFEELGLPIHHQIINVRDVFSGDPSTLVQHTKAPEGDYRDETMKSTVVNNRNVIFSAIIFAKALSLAKMEKTNVAIALGVHAGDHAIYPDCTEESTSMARELYRISNWDSELVEYLTPFVNISKDKVLRSGLDAMNELGLSKEEQSFILAHTISCYNATPDGKSCGKCGTCIEENQKVLMWDNTYKPIKDIKIGDKVWSLNEKTKKLEITTVIDVLPQGIQPVYDMNGLLLTSNHQVYASNKKARPKFREYGKMKRKDTTYMVKCWPTEFIRKDIDNINYAFGYLRGFVDGDGHIDRGIFTCQKQSDILTEFWEIYKQFINPKTNVNIKWDESRQMFVACGGYAKDFLENTSFNSNSKEYMRGYLNGIIIADGGISFNKSNQSLGVFIVQSESANYIKCENIKKCLDSLGFQYDFWKNKCFGFNQSGCNMMNWRIKTPYRLTFKYGSSKRDNIFEKISQHNSIRNLQSNVVSKINKPIMNSMTYDITTETHTFFCEGYLVHNCTERLEAFEMNGLKDPAPYVTE